LGVKSVNGFNGINGSVKKLDTLLIKRLLSYMFDFPLPEKDRESKVCDMLINAVKEMVIIKTPIQIMNYLSKKNA
jgi:hypothetical protein